MTPKTWINAHFRKNEVQLEINMQTQVQPAYIFRLVYRRVAGAPKGALARRQLRSHTSIGQTQWDGSIYALAMTDFEAENKALIRRAAQAWLSKDLPAWEQMRGQLETALREKAEGIT